MLCSIWLSLIVRQLSIAYLMKYFSELYHLNFRGWILDKEMTHIVIENLLITPKTNNLTAYFEKHNVN